MPDKSTSKSKQSSASKFQSVPVPKGKPEFTFTIGKPVVSSTQCPLPATVQGVTIQDHQQVKPREDETTHNWCDTSLWVTINGYPSAAVYPSSPSKGTTFIAAHNCVQHQCPGTLVVPDSVHLGDRLMITTTTGILTYEVCAPVVLSPKSGNLQWNNCNDGKDPDVVFGVCKNEPGNPSLLNTVVSFRLVQSKLR